MLPPRRARVVPVRLPGTRGRPAGDDLAYLRATYFAEREPLLKEDPKVPYRRTPIGRAYAWFVEDVLAQSLRVVRRNGASVAATAGVSPLRQWLQVVWLALRIPTMPEDYYKFEFFLPTERGRAGRYLNRYETKVVLYGLANGLRPLGRKAPLTDKTRFEAHATAAGLPVIPTLLELSQGEVVRGGDLPSQDLFSKPRAGKGGRGARQWLFDPETQRYTRVGGKPCSLDADALMEALRNSSNKEDWIVQPRIQAHRELADLSLGVAITCRVITILDENDRPEPLVAAVRLPAVEGRAVDNIHAGGISAAVDVTSGTMGPATDLGVEAGRGRLDTHPITGAAIAGRALPCWDEVLTLVVRAHEAFRPRVLVGWDVCITDDGPILVEGNSQPCVDHIQRTHAAPLGDHRFTTLLAWHVRRTLRERAQRSSSGRG